jgi:uncharacterized membrane protein (DUF373 family)
MELPSISDLPNEFDVLDWIIQKTQVIAATIVVLLFIIGVVDLGILIFEQVKTGKIFEVESVVRLIEFLLLLFIIVEVYRTIIAYARRKQPKYILTLVVYTGVIAIIRRILVFHPQDIESSTDAMFISIGFSVLLLSLGIMLFIIDQYGNPMENMDLTLTEEREEDNDEEREEDNDEEREE